MASCILLPFAQMDSSASKSCPWELAMSKTYNKIPEENKLFSQSKRMRWAWKNIVFYVLHAKHRLHNIAS
jgi:hypothetical protein